MELIRQFKPYLIFSALIILGLVIFASVSEGFYPIATVNGRIVTAHAFWRKYQTDSAYYENLSKSMELNLSSDTGEDLAPPSAEDLKRLALTGLIENIIIEKGAREELGEDLDSLIETKLQRIPEDENFKKAVAGLYGANLSDFVRDFMTPIAKQEILSGRLFLKGENFEDWLIKTKAETKIKIFSDEFYWDGQEVQLKK